MYYFLQHEIDFHAYKKLFITNIFFREKVKRADCKSSFQKQSFQYLDE